MSLTPARCNCIAKLVLIECVPTPVDGKPSFSIPMVLQVALKCSIMSWAEMERILFPFLNELIGESSSIPSRDISEMIISPQALTGHNVLWDLCWTIVWNFALFFCDSKVIATQSALITFSECGFIVLFLLRNLKFLMQRSFVCFSSEFFVSRYSQDLIPKNSAPVANRPRCLFFVVSLFLRRYLKTINGSAFWFFVLGSSLA